MEEERAELCRQLEQADTSLVLLGLLLCSSGLSWRGIAQQRQGLCRVLEGESERVPSVFPTRLLASALVVGALTYFFLLSLEGWQESRAGTNRERRSGELNAWAALLVLAAALVRLYDLIVLQREEDSPAVEQ